ncbi:HET-domain-containing protein [Epithele typhae]|uniref:HET-domain-containing protein n=1 Tax=Epithele typhae TaxID=378194 RepID=UPI002008B357|nr:HET-domain-containing protein [Epithele typhae]KAH9921547.1 HET-domain-containing protein [Epithele typhae]
MPCFSPLCVSAWRRVRGLLKKPKGASRVASRNQSSTTEIPPTIQPKPKDDGVDGVYSPPRSLVCDYCWSQGLFAPGPFQQAWISQTSFKDFSTATTWAQVEASASQGCQWCKLLLSTRTEAVLQDDLRYTVGFRIDSSRNGATPKGVQTLKLTIDDTPHSAYYVYTDRENPATPLIAARPKVLELSQPPTYIMATNVLIDCIRSHEQCPNPHSVSLPTRVVDCSDPQNPKLRIGYGEKAPYAVLSYVWGEGQAHCTTSENVEAYTLGINLDDLPQTIKDAISSTHSLGLRYLWVDALCILQDSREDKAREVAIMRTTFRNAYLTLVAANAKRVSEGFLQDRPLSSPPDIPLPFRFPDHQVGSFWLSPAWRQYDGSTEPVNRRAWCLVERLLSPRVLLYASHTLQFQCQSSVVNIGNAVCPPRTLWRLPDLLFQADADMSKPLSQEDKKTLYYAWNEAIGEYTHRALTDPGDKLLAFAPIAELFQRALKSDYLAGVWADNVVDGLLWYKNSGTRQRRPDAYRAPSWSWASVDGRVMAQTVDDRLDGAAKGTESCEVMACETTILTELLPLGEVIDGTLTVRAVIVAATWNPESSMPEVYLQPSVGMPGSMPGTAQAGPSTMLESPLELIHIGSAYPDSVENVHEVWAVPLRWNTTTEYAAGLIVARASSNEDETKFRRVGYFRTSESAPLWGLCWMSDREAQEVVLV